ncbi:MAG: two-component regulator propeller domain-containing protein [Acidobacteriota bacterium]
MSGTAVDALAFDARGFLWIGSSEGLVRYDGVESRRYGRGEPGRAELPVQPILELHAAADGALWIGMDGGGLARLDPETESFTFFRNDPNDPQSLGSGDVLALAEDADGALWIATSRGGLSVLADPSTSEGRFRRLRHDPADPQSLPSDRTRALLFDREGTLWVASMGGLSRRVGRGRFEHAQMRPERADALPDNEVWSVFEDDRGAIWAGTYGGGTVRLRPDRRSAPLADAAFDVFRRSDDSFSPSDNRVMAFHQDTQGTLWIATLGGLNEVPAGELDQESPRFIRHLPMSGRHHALAHHSISSFADDPEGNLWIGLAAGVAKLDHDSGRLPRLTPGPEGGLSGRARDAVIDARGELWVATGVGLDRVTLPTDRYGDFEVETYAVDSPERALPAKDVRGVYQTRDGTLWIETFQGLHYLGRDRRSVKSRTEGLLSQAVLSLFEDRGGDLWMGMYRGLQRIRRGEDGGPQELTPWLSDLEDPSSLGGSAVARLAQTPDGALWMGSYNGLHRLHPDGASFDRFLPDPERDDALPHEFVSALHVDREGTLWVGTLGGGLSRVTEDLRFETISLAEGLPSSNVQSIASDPENRLWVATPLGLVILADSQMRVLGERDGLGSDDVDFVADSGAGALIVAGGELLHVPFDQWDAGRGSPEVVLTDLQVNNEQVTPGADSVLNRVLSREGKITLGAEQRSVTFAFAAPTYRDPASIEYRYRLDGYQDDWVLREADERRAIYSGLPAGEFTFRVQSRRPSGDWGASEASVEMEVLPFWWETSWAQATALLAFAAIVVSGPLLWARRAERQKRLLESRVHERTRELAQANYRLQEAARKDHLTGLANRAAFLERAEIEQIARRREQRPLTVALADIDYFKRVNDRFGHDCGDEVLRRVAVAFVGSLRERDLVARWGGEEFAFLFPETDLDGAFEVAEKLRRAVEALELRWHEDTFDLSITVGVSTVGTKEDIEHALSVADQALYEGKRSGRNRVLQASA